MIYKALISFIIVALVALVFIIFLYPQSRCCDECICPGLGAGSIHLRMPEHAVIELIGEPTKRIVIGEIFYLIYANKGILVSGQHDSGVATISLFDQRDGILNLYQGSVAAFRGKIDGYIGIGSSKADVEVRFGPINNEAGVYNRNHSGATFFFDESDNVQVIQIHQFSD